MIVCPFIIRMPSVDLRGILKRCTTESQSYHFLNFPNLYIILIAVIILNF
jgi:hypothetical protein